MNNAVFNTKAIRGATGSFNGPVSYPTNGVPTYAGVFGLSQVYEGEFVGYNASGVPTHRAFISTIGDLGSQRTLGGISTVNVFITTLAGVEVANATNLSALTFTGIAWGA